MPMQSQDGNSADILNSQKDKLRQLFPEVFSDGKIDFAKLKATLGDDVELGEQYGLGWKGKSQTFGVIQDPTTKTLKPARDESVDYDATNNVFIEGDNLDVLKVLQKSYYGKVKMIYIDPPYNTGNDFVYNDVFKQNKAEYRQDSGLTDSEGKVTRTDGLTKNSKDSGHYHSNWLNMMYPRLYLARNLLRQDGVIFVSIDDNEVHNLRQIMNEIFGEENFIAQFIWEKRVTRENRRNISIRHDYIVVFARDNGSIEQPIKNIPMDEVALGRYANPDNDSRGDWTSAPATAQAGHATQSQFYSFTTPSGRVLTPPAGRCWLYTEKKMHEQVVKNNIWFGKDGNGVPRVKKFLKDEQGLTPETLLLAKTVGTNDSAKRSLIALFSGQAVFDTPKPVELIKTILATGSDKNSIVMDFFCGTGTTAHAVELLNAEDGGNRQWICVQLPEQTDENSEAYKAGYKTIADIAKERIRRAGVKIATDHAEALAKRAAPLDLGFKVLKLSDTNFKLWDTSVDTEEDLRQQMIDNLNPIKDGTNPEDLLAELALKSGVDFAAPRQKVETPDGAYCKIGDDLVICLHPDMSEQLFTAILATKPQKIILLDSSLHNNDQLKTNLLLQATQANIELTVV